MTSTLNFYKALKKRDRKLTSNLEGCLKSQDLLRSILTHDFTFASDENDSKYNPLIEYLYKSKLDNFAAFLQQFHQYSHTILKCLNLRDKLDTHEILVLKSLQPYKKFFERENPYFINPEPELIGQFYKALSNECFSKFT